MAEIIDGKSIARGILAEVREGVAALGGPSPLIVALDVGGDDASLSYVRAQARKAQKVGIGHRLESLPRDVTWKTFAATVQRLDRDLAVTGLMLQMPLPPQLDGRRARALLSPDRDVEAVGIAAQGHLFAGDHVVAPPTAVAAIECLKSAVGGALAGLRVAVVGRSEIVGRPAALLLLHANATVTVCHSRTRDLGAVLREQDAVICAVGRPGLIRGAMIRPGAVVIDVGTNWVEGPDGGRMVGDAAFDEVAERAAAVTPVPGGVGPVTVAVLLRNALALARRRQGDDGRGAEQGR